MGAMILAELGDVTRFATPEKVLAFAGLDPSIYQSGIRELGSERRETVRSLSGAGAGYLRGAVLSTRGPGWTGRWCTCWESVPWQGSQARTG